MSDAMECFDRAAQCLDRDDYDGLRTNKTSSLTKNQP
jgi:hypothetical protein